MDQIKHMKSRKKILLSAYACLPNAGSEPGLGWNWMIRLSRLYDVWLITEENESASVLRKYIPTNCPNEAPWIHVVGIPRNRFGERISRHFFYYLTYRWWQQEAFAKAKELNDEHRFDLVHQLNMIGFREPGYLWKLNIPFIWGPVGGLINFPYSYISVLSISARWEIITKNILNSFQKKIAIRPRTAGKFANLVFAANSGMQKEIEKNFNIKAICLHETGANLVDKVMPIDRYADRPLRIVWCGGHFPRKMLDFALKIIYVASKKVRIEFHVMGRGTDSAIHKAKELKISEGVCHWHGTLTHSAVQKLMQESDILLFTSLVEGTPHVVLESLSLGRPVLCFDTSGQGDLIDDTCGMKVPVTNPEESIELFSDHIQKIAKNRTILFQKSVGAIKKAKDLSWDNLIGKVAKYYDSIL